MAFLLVYDGFLLLFTMCIQHANSLLNLINENKINNLKLLPVKNGYILRLLDVAKRQKK